MIWNYVAAGMHSSLIGDMGKVSTLRVISETTSKAYKDDRKSIREISEELNLDAVVEASVFCYGDTICMRMKLFSGELEERQLWAQDYFVEKSQVLNLYHDPDQTDIRRD